MSIGNIPETLSQRIVVGIILVVGGLGEVRHRLNGYLASWVPGPPGKHVRAAYIEPFLESPGSVRPIGLQGQHAREVLDVDKLQEEQPRHLRVYMLLSLLLRYC